MPKSDVGRNDPCPCGSGRKYKKCCLRKQKQREPASKHDWRTKFVKILGRPPESDSRVSFEESEREIAETVFEAWELLDEHLPEEVTRFEGAVEELGYPNLRLNFVLHRGVVAFVDASVGDEAFARKGLAYVDGLLGRFTEISEEDRHDLESHRGELLGRAGDWEAAVPIFERLVDRQPDRSRGYGLLADALLEKEQPEAERAVALLEEALDDPVADPGSWSLRGRLQDAREAAGLVDEESEVGHYATEEGESEWESYWEAFDAATLDERFEMARRSIREEPHLDGEWAFAFLIDELLMPAEKEDRQGDWLELLDELRRQHPEVTRQEGGPLGFHELRFRLAGGGEVEEAIDLLFARPSENIDYIYRAYRKLSYHGRVDGLVEHFKEGWPAIEASDNLRGDAPGRWSQTTLELLTARWAREEVERARTLEEIDEGLGPMADQLATSFKEPFGQHFLGEHGTRERLSAMEQPEDTSTWLIQNALGFCRTLVDRHDWPASKALFLGDYLETFFGELVGLDDGSSSSFGTERAGEVATLRKRLRDEAWIVPDPDIVDGYARYLLESGFFGEPHAAAGFLEAIVCLVDWLVDESVISDERFADSLASHLSKRLEALSERIVAFDDDPLVAENLERALEASSA